MESRTKDKYNDSTSPNTTEMNEPSAFRFSTSVVSVHLHRSYTHYHSKLAMATGGLQILLGLFSIALGIAQPIIETTFGRSGIGIWCGVVFVLAGFVGIVSGKKKEPEWIVPHMIFSILASLLAGLLFAVVVTAAVYDNLSYLSNQPRLFESKPIAGNNTVAVDCLLAIAAFLEGLVSITAAAISCRVTCCNNNFHASQKEVENPNILSYQVTEARKYTVNPSRF